MERLYIGGDYVDSSATSVIEVENPATEEVLAEVPDASSEDIDRAIGAAQRAQRGWQTLDGLTRADTLTRGSTGPGSAPVSPSSRVTLRRR